MKFASEIKFDGFTRSMNAWREHFKKSPRATLKTHSRLLIKKVIAFTPPQGDDDSTPLTQGKRAVANQIRRAVLPLRPKDFRKSKRIREMVQKRDYAGLTSAFANGDFGAYSRLQVVPFTPQVHQSQRDRRGRVRSKTRFATPDAPEVEAYIKRKQGNVGNAKGGWARAYTQLGGTASKWVARHSIAGTFVDKLNDERDAFFKAANKSEWAKGGDQDRVVLNAMASRADQIQASIEDSIRKRQKAGSN